MKARKTNRKRWLRAVAFGCAVLAGAGCFAQDAGSPDPAKSGAMAGLSQDEKWRRRFPQPVLVSDLIGRLVLDLDQGVLGRIDTLVRDPDGEVRIVFSKRSFFVFRGATVAVPAKAAALLGPFVMVLDLSKDEVGRLPPWTASDAAPVDRASRIEMALTKH